MRLTLLLLRPIYYLLYHTFAWAYDLIAATISLGRWNGWVRAILPYIEGQRILELGHGPGHLQAALHDNGFVTFGLDESPQMLRQAAWRLREAGAQPQLARGLAQALPYPAAAFDGIASTFPAEYIFDPRTLEEVYRVLAPGGKFVILPMAWITGTRPLERLMAWLFRVSGEAPGKPGPVSAAVKDRFARGGFEVRSEIVAMKGSQVLIVVAEKR